ncbi:MAG: dihydrolipoyllysine-residue succinyltransferase [Nitrosospira sp.]|nr:dihydrolipoyllysine-residue succinyltransferase [Nitrosospira sp.]MDW7643042.1 dihydrolipoyllysine-residue succinyltransferase [Nitrosomonadaceae bacterium]MBI0407406.1 dihydrolipoyllysine-residue succinyltransferase [Nitrosospira sp.]MBI0414412.1 dihydrolipoyllysine-residue succinyltransferase [Nitrosospira sp.]MBI0415723.1 dihydrolipoyllysine-residue succinyltransferase [Nitrosospira sp.]
MLIEVKVPLLSESVEEATLISWNKRPGEHVERNENLIDIETDKVVLELPALASGILIEVIKDDGATVIGGEIIAIIDTGATIATEVTPDIIPVVQEDMKKKDAGFAKINVISNIKDSERRNQESALITQTKTKSSLVSTVTSMKDSVTNRPEKRIAMSRLRLRIAERLVQSQSTTATLTTFNEVNMQAIIELRARYKDRFEKEYGVKLGFTSFFVRAVVVALQKFPIINASVEGQDIVHHDYYDIGIAVGSKRGLVVPIIRDADRLSQANVEKLIIDFSSRAQEGKLTIEELTGGTFSITNGGVFGSVLSVPIINPPQSAILGIHATKERPVAENGQVVIRPINYLALSYDHRIIDGREAVLFLVAVKEALENPISPFPEI